MITARTFNEYNPECRQIRIVDEDEHSIITYDLSYDYLHVDEKNPDGDSSTLISLHDGSTAMLFEDGVIQTTPPCDEMLRRAYSMALTGGNFEAAIQTWRLMQSLMLRLRLMQKLDDGGNLSIVVLQ